MGQAAEEKASSLTAMFFIRHPLLLIVLLIVYAISHSNHFMLNVSCFKVGA